MDHQSLSSYADHLQFHIQPAATEILQSIVQQTQTPIVRYPFRFRSKLCQPPNPPALDSQWLCSLCYHRIGDEDDLRRHPSIPFSIFLFILHNNFASVSHLYISAYPFLPTIDIIIQHPLESRIPAHSTDAMHYVTKNSKAQLLISTPIPSKFHPLQSNQQTLPPVLRPTERGKRAQTIQFPTPTHCGNR